MERMRTKVPWARPMRRGSVSPWRGSWRNSPAARSLSGDHAGDPDGGSHRWRGVPGRFRAGADLCTGRPGPGRVAPSWAWQASEWGKGAVPGPSTEIALLGGTLRFVLTLVVPRASPPRPAPGRRAAARGLAVADRAGHGSGAGEASGPRGAPAGALPARVGRADPGGREDHHRSERHEGHHDEEHRLADRPARQDPGPRRRASGARPGRQGGGPGSGRTAWAWSGRCAGCRARPPGRKRPFGALPTVVARSEDRPWAPRPAPTGSGRRRRLSTTYSRDTGRGSRLPRTSWLRDRMP